MAHLQMIFPAIKLHVYWTLHGYVSHNQRVYWDVTGIMAIYIYIYVLLNMYINIYIYIWSCISSLYPYIYIYGWLVVSTPLKNMKVNGKDYPKYEMENKIHVWNHQPDIDIYIYIDRCHRDGGFAIFVIGKTPNVQSWLPWDDPNPFVGIIHMD